VAQKLDACIHVGEGHLGQGLMHETITLQARCEGRAHILMQTDIQMLLLSLRVQRFISHCGVMESVDCEGAAVKNHGAAPEMVRDGRSSSMPALVVEY
jgi:hypothetical protein